MANDMNEPDETLWYRGPVPAETFEYAEGLVEWLRGAAGGASHKSTKPKCGNLFATSESEAVIKHTCRRGKSHKGLCQCRCGALSEPEN